MILQTLGLVLLYALMRRFNLDTTLVRTWCVVWGASSAGGIALDPWTWWWLSPATGYIWGLTLSLGLGTAAARRWSSSKPNALSHGRPMPAATSVPRHTQLLLASLLPAYLSVHLLIGDLGQSYSVFLSLDELVASAAAASIARYSEDFDPAPLTRLLSSFMFLSALLAGWLATRRDAPGRWWWMAASLLPALLWMILLTTKANLLLWMVFAGAAYLAFRPRKVTASELKSRRWLWPLALVGLVALMFSVQASRAGGFEAIELADLVGVLTVSAIGHVFALREWFDQAADLLPESLGARSFAGLFELLGANKREIGMYPDENVDVGESFTNVYSALRNLVEDLGVPLSLLLFVGMGWLGARTQEDRTPPNRAVLAVLLCWTIWSPITSIFNYNSLLFACGLLVAASLALGRARTTPQA